MPNILTVAPLFSRLFRVLASATLGLICSVAAASAQAIEPGVSRDTRSATEWQRAAIDDIDEGYRITLENHPGVHDVANPGFLDNLAVARKKELALAEKVTNGAGYAAAIERFNVSIRDGHAGMVTTLAPGDVGPERWPGFVTIWRGAALYVYASEEAGVAACARVLACDGKPIRDLIVDNVFGLRGRIDEPGHWWVHARVVFFDLGNPFISVPKCCRFDVQGKVREHVLTWRPGTQQYSAWRMQGYNGETLPVGLSEPRPGLFWAALPSFDPNDTERDAYRAMTREIAEHRARYLNADALVVDLRNNQGGSSTWSKEFAFALWGKNRVTRRSAAYSSKTEVWWRASKDNTQYMTELVDVLSQQGQAQGAQWARAISLGMKAALARGDTFYMGDRGADVAPAGDPNADLPDDPAPFIKPMYVIVPGQCASACLDAVDVFTRFSNTVLIGAPSAADSTYMDVRRQNVRSGLASVIIPNKVYVNRPRANGQFYLPAVYVKDRVWSVENLLKVVEAQLKRKRGAKSRP